MALPYDVRELIPHTGAARVVEEVLERSGDGIVCAGRIPARHALVRANRAPAFVALELAAQAAGVLLALSSLERGSKPPVGYLVSARDVKLERAEIEADVPLVASVRSVGGAGALALYEVSVAAAGEVGLTGTIGVFRADGPQESTGGGR
jgi:predicted hotdog family 3-hydroxylacyl-ACP dehydratase